MIYDVINIFILDKNINLKFDRSYLEVIDDGNLKSWFVDIIGNNDDQLFHDSQFKRDTLHLKFKTENGNEFDGAVLITSHQIGPLGSTVRLTGTGVLNGYDK